MTDSRTDLLIYTPTYNQAAYIEQTLTSLVRQRLDLPFTILVIDDGSTDGTADIVRRLAADHQHLIRAVLREQNLGVHQGQPPQLDEYAPEFLAICEGDDFWTDDLKLQKQVDFLRAHPDCALCFHPGLVFYEDHSAPDHLFPSPEFRFNKARLDFNDLLQRNFMVTNSVLYRWRYGRGREHFSDVFPKNMQPGDWFIHLLHAETGAIGFIDEVMSTYRRHSGSLWTGDGRGYDFFHRNGLSHLRFFEEVSQRFQVDESRRRTEILAKTVTSLLVAEDYVTLAEILQTPTQMALLAGRAPRPGFLTCWRHRLLAGLTRRRHYLEKTLVYEIWSAILTREVEKIMKIRSRHADFFEARQQSPVADFWL